MKVHTMKSEFTCKRCGNGFRAKETLDAHKCKGKKQMYDCVFCDQVFTNRLAAVRHRQTEHRGPKGSNYKCDFCQKEFYAYSELVKHRVSHTGERKFLCKVCGISYANTSSFRAHKCSGPPQKCKVCQEVFKTPAQLTKHMYSHTGAKPFNCDICKRGFQFSGNFKTHNCNYKAKPKRFWKGKKL